MHRIKLTWQERQSDSPLVESIWTCSTPVAVSHIAIADPCISFAIVRNNSGAKVVLTGPKTKSYRALLPAGYSCATIRLKPGVYLKKFSTQGLINSSVVFSADSQSRFSFEGVQLQFPDFDHAEQLIGQLYDLGFLGQDLPGEDHATGNHLSPRTYFRQVKRTTGLSPYQLYQLRRMHQALRLLKQGVPAAKVASELAFTDQSHLIRASRHFLGHTPKRLFDLPQTP